MNRLFPRLLGFLRRMYVGKLKGGPQPRPLSRLDDPDAISDIIYRLLTSEAPCMISRFGSCELNCAVNALGVKEGPKKWLSYIQGKAPAFWWEENVMNSMKSNAGFFSNTPEQLSLFGERYLNDARKVDVLGSWCDAENDVQEYITRATKVNLLYLEPYFAAQPWSRALAGKKVLVVHPFASLIEQQYREHRQQLFTNTEVLPEFQLMTMQAVQSIGGDSNGFDTWFDALKYMEQEIDKREYDICIIGCGAYGLPLAAHVKRQGKKAIHLGGATQLLFGIKGKRWENPDYGTNEPNFPTGFYLRLFNEYWRRPGESDKPASASRVEGGCYW